MPALMLQRTVPQQNNEQQITQLQKELAECGVPVRLGLNKLKNFMIANEIWSISELDYGWRVEYQKALATELASNTINEYLKSFDKIKRYSLKKQMRITANGRDVRPAYKNELLYLPYHPVESIASQFENAGRKQDFLWDFTIHTSEQLKQQVYSILHYILENAETMSGETNRTRLAGLRYLYQYCIEENIHDIEQIELHQAEKFCNVPTERLNAQKMASALNYCRYALFMQADEINWNANVWYLDRFQLQPERINESNEVKSLSFLEVASKENRDLMKKYARYSIGITNITIGVIRAELINIRKFLIYLNQTNVCTVASEQMNEYFRIQREKEIKPGTYNGIVMTIQHFFHFLFARQYIERIPFDAECLLKKTMPQHHNRSVSSEVYEEILAKLYVFPETIRLMYLHLWGIGLRISEVCTLKGDAYYIQGEDAWIQVYQVKMKAYKRIPIPDALYKLMKVYLKKYEIKADDYVFKGKKGGAFRTGNFTNQMKKYYKINNIQGGEYLFKSHDYRHTIATQFYDTGVPLQSIREYLGHDYEEMTEQYIDYMPKKIARASDEFFSTNSLLATMRGGENENG